MINYESFPLSKNGILFWNFVIPKICGGSKINSKFGCFKALETRIALNCGSILARILSHFDLQWSTHQTQPRIIFWPCRHVRKPTMPPAEDISAAGSMCGTVVSCGPWWKRHLWKMLVLKNGQCSQRHEFLPFRTALPRNATQRYTKMMAIHLRCLNNVEEEYSTYKVGRILATIVRIQLTRIPLNASIQHSPVNMGLSANRLPPIPIQVWTMITIRMKIRIYRVSMIFHKYDTSWHIHIWIL